MTSICKEDALIAPSYQCRSSDAISRNVTRNPGVCLVRSRKGGQLFEICRTKYHNLSHDTRSAITTPLSTPIWSMAERMNCGSRFLDRKKKPRLASSLVCGEKRKKSKEANIPAQRRHLSIDPAHEQPAHNLSDEETSQGGA